MNQPHVGPLDPRPGDNGSPPLPPTRLVRIVEGDTWTEYDFPSMQKANHGILGDTHPDLR
jgi:hypothetical protein